MQLAVIEFARHVAAIPDAHSTEFDVDTPYPIVALIEEWGAAGGAVRRIRQENADYGGTMRLGGQTCRLVDGSRARAIYGKDDIIERHRHRYEVNTTLLGPLEDKGLKVSAWSDGGRLCEIVEVNDHPWFIACQVSSGVFVKSASGTSIIYFVYRGGVGVTGGKAGWVNAGQGEAVR